MKRFLIGSIFVLCLWSNVAGAACQADVIAQLFQQLQPAVPWLDINPQSSFVGCDLTIRYYPCETSIDSLLKNAVSKITHHYCVLIWFGTHVHTEDYCVVKDARLSCF